MPCMPNNTFRKDNITKTTLREKLPIQTANPTHTHVWYCQGVCDSLSFVYIYVRHVLIPFTKHSEIKIGEREAFGIQDRRADAIGNGRKWHRPFQMATTVYETENCVAVAFTPQWTSSRRWKWLLPFVTPGDLYIILYDIIYIGLIYKYL